MTQTIRSRCRWCGGAFEQQGGRGRPAEFCKRSHRQRHYEAKRLADARKLAADDVLLSRAEFERIRDAMYVLETTLIDARNDLVDGTADYPDAFTALAGAAQALTGEGMEPKAIG